MDKLNQCRAKSKQSGQRCKRYTTKGMNVCRIHGGVLGSKKSKEKRRRAALRHGLCTKKALQERKRIRQLIKSCSETLSKVNLSQK